MRRVIECNKNVIGYCVCAQPSGSANSCVATHRHTAHTSTGSDWINTHVQFHKARAFSLFNKTKNSPPAPPPRHSSSLAPWLGFRSCNKSGTAWSRESGFETKNNFTPFTLKVLHGRNRRGLQSFG